MTATQLRFLRVLGLELIADGIEQLHVALLRVFLQGGDESPGHGACGLAGDTCVGSAHNRPKLVSNNNIVQKPLCRKLG